MQFANGKPKNKTSSFHSIPTHKPFQRESELPKLIGIWPSDLEDTSLENAAKIVALLRKMLRAERQRGRTGHWAYDLNRHLTLAEALKAERERLRNLGQASGSGSEARVISTASLSRVADRTQRIKSRKRAAEIASRLSARVFLRAAGAVELISDADG